jgi:hypothetical protein
VVAPEFLGRLRPSQSHIRTASYPLFKLEFQVNKIPTVFQRDWDGNPKYVTREPNPECAWVFAGEGVPTVKWDGTCVMLDDEGRWWARREVKPGKAAPPNYVAVAADPETGKTNGWEPVEQSAFAKLHKMARGWALHKLNYPPDLEVWEPGTYELIGPRINGNPQSWPHHDLVRHGRGDALSRADVKSAPRDYDGLAAWLHARPYEGIVWHHPDGRMAKIKARDFPAEQGGEVSAR